MAEKKQGRTRNFATVVYSESAPNDWQNILSEHCVPAFISPIHDKDKNSTGEDKKPHYHVLIMFDSVKTNEQAKELFNTIGGVGCERVGSLRGYARYLCHLDNPEKVQYNIDDVKQIAGADYRGIIGLASDKFIAFEEMEEFCEKYNVVSFYALCKYATKNRKDWSRVLKESGSIYMREYLQSRKWSQDMGLCDIVDPATGEVIN